MLYTHNNRVNNLMLLIRFSSHTHLSTYMHDANRNIQNSCKLHALIRMSLLLSEKVLSDAFRGMLLLHSEDLSDACAHRDALTSLLVGCMRS